MEDVTGVEGDSGSEVGGYGIIVVSKVALNEGAGFQDLGGREEER